MPDQKRSGVSAIVLAAGLATRMGTVKALVPVRGRPMLQSILETLAASCVDETVVVLGHSADIIQGAVSFGNARPVMNERYREGMASSLQRGLASISPESSAALVVPADQPFLKSQTIDQLIEEYRSRKPEIVLPLYNGFRGNPVLLDRSVFGEVAQLSGDVGCRAIFGSHARGILKLPVKDAGVLIDIDTKEDLGRFESSAPPDSVLFESADLSGRNLEGPQLVVVGQDPVARALVRFANLLDFNVVLVDPFTDAGDTPAARILHVLDLSTLAQSDELFVVVASRGRFDEEAIEQALNMDAAYVAVLANRRRAQELLSRLREKGIPDEKLDRIRAPAGLDIGASTPAEIALSIMAEAVAHRRAARRT